MSDLRISRMSRESKFGYGFLLFGLGMPYLIDKVFGPVIALITAIACAVIGLSFLVAGHMHKETEAATIKIGKRRDELLLPIVLGSMLLVGIPFMLYTVNHPSTNPIKLPPVGTPRPSPTIHIPTAEEIAEAVKRNEKKPPDQQRSALEQEDVYRNLKFGVDLPSGVHPRLSMFSVSNWGKENIGAHEIACEMNLLVLEFNLVQNGEGVAKFSEAPLVASGGTQSDACLSPLGYPPESTPLCFDVTINFSYVLETQPAVKKLKSTRFVGFPRGGVFSWTEQPAGQQTSYCVEAQKAREDRHKNDQ
jgi:hypothetical protein